MMNLCIGLICLVFSLFLFFFSPKEKNNMFGYKSLQLNTHKMIWYWSNKCFGLLLMIGSILYIIGAVILKFNQKFEFSSTLNKYGLCYIFIIFVITELYTFAKQYKDKQVSK